MAFIISPPNINNPAETNVVLVNLYGTGVGAPLSTFIAMPQEGGIAPPSGGGESSYAYVA